ncbi:MAG: tetratricopeptide repeat protein [bacterium]|nr:MAG: tetratricopeptide repeat protein [bacterium]
MKKCHVILCTMLVSLLAFYACKSVETTSAMLHNQHGNYDKAIEMAMLALEKKPNDAEAHFQLGISYSYTGKMKESYIEFQEAARLDPKKLNDVENNIKHNWATHFNNGVSEYSIENMEGAEKEFKLATEADPRHVKGWLNLAKVQFRLAQDDSTYLEPAFESVDTLLARVTPDEEEYANVLSLSGKVMIRRGMQDRAIDIFEKLMLDDPANFEIVEEVAGDFVGQKEWESAATFYEMAADGRRKTDSEDFEVYYNLGVIYFKLERFMEAIDAYQNTLRMKPDDRQASYSLLLTYYQAEFYDEAIMMGQQYTQTIAPEEARGWQILSLSYNKKGMKIKAEEAFQKFKELSQ